MKTALELYESADRSGNRYGAGSCEEQELALSDRYAYYYARNVIGGRFELGEEAIATDGYYSYHYAYMVLGGRFELGEAAISNSARFSYFYAKDSIKGRFFPGEKSIADVAAYAYSYSTIVVGGRFKLGEDTILESSHAGGYVSNHYDEFTGEELTLIKLKYPIVVAGCSS